MNDDWRFRISLMVAFHGFRRTIWMYGCAFVTTGLFCGSLFMFVIRPGFWLVWLIGLWLAWLVLQEGNNYWWERWTGPYPSPDLSFLLPPYLQDNIAAMQEGTYRAAWDVPFEIEPELDAYQPRHSRDWDGL